MEEKVINSWLFESNSFNKHKLGRQYFSTSKLNELIYYPTSNVSRLNGLVVDPDYMDQKMITTFLLSLYSEIV